MRTIISVLALAAAVALLAPAAPASADPPALVFHSTNTGVTPATSTSWGW